MYEQKKDLRGASERFAYFVIKFTAYICACQEKSGCRSILRAGIFAVKGEEI